MTHRDSSAAPTTSTATAGLDAERDPEEALQHLRSRATSSRPAATPRAVEAPAVFQANRRTVYIIGAIAIVVLVAVGWIGYRGEVNAGTLADLAATGEVQANRDRATREVLGYPDQSCAPGLAESVTLECANRDLARLGLPPVVAVDGLSPSQLAALAGEARSDAKRAATERGEGPGAGVIPPSTSGRFPGGS